MAEAAKKSAWDEKRTVFIERGMASEEQSQFVCVNGRTFQVPKGKNVEVPLPVYEVIANARMPAGEGRRQVNAHDGMKQRKGQKCPFFW